MLYSDTGTRNRSDRTNGGPQSGRAPIGQGIWGQVGGASPVSMWAGEGGDQQPQRRRRCRRRRSSVFGVAPAAQAGLGGGLGCHRRRP